MAKDHHYAGDSVGLVRGALAKKYVGEALKALKNLGQFTTMEFLSAIEAHPKSYPTFYEFIYANEPTEDDLLTRHRAGKVRAVLTRMHSKIKNDPVVGRFHRVFLPAPSQEDGKWRWDTARNQLCDSESRTQILNFQMTLIGLAQDRVAKYKDYVVLVCPKAGKVIKSKKKN